ncbi:MAG: proline--tRNA ligase [Herpetosiphonaceae bacterium]|nr:proline--tRNA ligase [Herpetosiphonaceae bacterium]
MAKAGISTRADNYAQWYLDIVDKADLAEPSGVVRGAMVIKPTGYAVWEGIQRGLDQRIKATGHVNAYFPLFIPQSFLQKEAQHVAGFAPEVAVVTHAGGKQLEEPYVVRPTSEAIIGHTYSRWIQSWRDLPVLINQWANVVRWELRPRPFLRTTEFLWQEGHTAHATEAEAEAETLMILHDVYADFVENVMAIPLFRGLKSKRETFAGALRTYAIEAMMQDGRALQSGTSHNLGQNFARAFDITYQTPDNQREHVWTTSWGASTRLIGGLIMVHSDDDGLVLPPRLAPIQVVVVPIYKTEAEKTLVMEAVQRLTGSWAGRFSFKIDDREHLSPGFKYNEWEIKGVPLRVEVGPKDVQKGSVAIARRDIPGRDGKAFVPQDGLAERIADLLEEIQTNLFERARRYRDERTIDVTSYGELAEAVEQGFARAYWAGSDADEAKIQDDLKATIRVIPFDQPEQAGKCVVTGVETTRQVLFARSY